MVHSRNSRRRQGRGLPLSTSGTRPKHYTPIGEPFDPESYKEMSRNLGVFALRHLGDCKYEIINDPKGTNE